jgi:hypothetical protein
MVRVRGAEKTVGLIRIFILKAAYYCQPPGEHFRQLSLLDRLGNEIAHSGQNALLPITLHGQSRHGNDGNAWI